MASYNDITGDKIQTRVGLSEQGQANWDSIFPPKKKERWVPPPLVASAKATTDQPMESAQQGLWTDEDERRQEIVGQNGNIGYSLDIETVSQSTTETKPKV
jgi:hypothetical protein